MNGYERSKAAERLMAECTVEEIEAMHKMASTDAVAQVFRLAVLAQIPRDDAREAYMRMCNLDRSRALRT